MLHHCSAEGQRALLIKMEIMLELQVMRCRDKAAVLLRALRKRQRFSCLGPVSDNRALLTPLADVPFGPFGRGRKCNREKFRR